MQLHSNIIGSGKPFIILHGFLGMGDNWKSLGNEFAKNLILTIGSNEGVQLGQTIFRNNVYLGKIY